MLMVVSLVLLLAAGFTEAVSLSFPHPPPPPTMSGVPCTPFGFLFVPPITVAQSDEMIRLTAEATLLCSCCVSSPTYRWFIPDLPNQAQLKRAANVLVLPRGALSAATHAGAVFASSDGIQFAAANFTIVIESAEPIVKISGGDRIVAAQSPFAILCEIHNVDRVSWSACLLNSKDVCETSITYLLSWRTTNIASIAFSALGFQDEGRVNVTVTGTTGDYTVTSSIMVSVDASTAPINSVAIVAPPMRTLFVGLPVVLVATASIIPSVFTWSDPPNANVLSVMGPVLTFVPKAVGSFTITVNATGKFGKPPARGVATVSLDVVELPFGKCTVTSPDNVIVGGESTITIAASSWSGAPGTAFRFGFDWLQNFAPVSPDYLQANSFNFTAPLVLSGTQDITFGFEASLGGSQRYNRRVTCNATIHASSNVTEVVALIQERMTDAAANGDVDETLRNAMDLLSAIMHTSNSGLSISTATRRGLLSTGSAAADVFDVIGAISRVTEMWPTTTTQKGLAADVISRALRNITTAAFASDGNTTQQVSLLVRALEALLLPASTDDAPTTSDAIDALAHAADLLAAITDIPVAALSDSQRNARQSLVRQLAMAMASQLALGDFANVSSAGASITATKMPASQMAGAPFAAPDGSSITLSLDALAAALNVSADVVGVMNGDVSVSAARHTTNPVPTASVANGEALVGAIVEFDATLSGAAFTDLSAPITIKMSSPGGSKCVYFDAIFNTWSTAGVTTVSFDASTGLLTCNTTHLSMFSATATATSAPFSSTTAGGIGTTTAMATSNGSIVPPTTTVTAPGNSSNNSDSSGNAPNDSSSGSSTIIIIVVILVILVVAVVVAIVVIVRLRRANSNDANRKAQYDGGARPIPARRDAAVIEMK